MSEPIVKLAETSYYDIPAVLRAIADGMEAGTYGEVYDLVVVQRNELDGILLHCGGPRATPERSHMLLMRGAAWLQERHL